MNKLNFNRLIDDRILTIIMCNNAISYYLSILNTFDKFINCTSK